MALSELQAKLVADNLQVLSTAGVPFAVARLFMAQAMHETAGFASNVFRNNNNAFGMKVPSKRKSPFILGAGTQPPANEGTTPYAKYASVADSFKDAVHRAKYNSINFSKTDTLEGFLKFTRDTGYFGYTPSETAVNIYRSGLTNKIALLGNYLEPAFVTTMKKKIPLVASIVLVLLAVATFIWWKRKKR